MTTNPDTEWGRAMLPSLPTADTSSISEDNGEEETVEVAIVGGGLAGLATAIGLQQANIPCKVYERSPQLRSNSQGILAIQPNGMHALEQIHPDLPAMIVEAGCERQQLTMTKIHADGSVEETVRETGQESMTKYGCLKVGITWHKMQQLLASLLPPDVIVTSRSLVSFQEDQGSVLLHFEDCFSTSSTDDPVRKRVRATAVVACDGVFSVARRQIIAHHNREDPPIYFGQLNWATVIETNQLPPDVHIPNAVHYFMHEGEPRWMSMLNDGGAGQTFWQFRVADPEMALSLSANKGRGGLGLKGVKEALLPVAKPSQLVSKAIQRIPETQIFERSIVGRLPALTWLSQHGRVALVGDSAHGMHPNIAQGFNSAAESSRAAVHAMAQEFQRCQAKGEDTINWRAAFKTYEQNRKPRADIVQRWANMMGCLQATGKLDVSQEVISKTMDWIVGEEPENYPSQETLDLIFAFDPLSVKGVSKIT